MDGIRQAREQAGLNQSELARQIKVTPRAVRAMEEPGRYPSAERLPAIADALECSIDALFGRIDKAAQMAPVHCGPPRASAPTVWEETAGTNPRPTEEAAGDV